MARERMAAAGEAWDAFVASLDAGPITGVSSGGSEPREDEMGDAGGVNFDRLRIGAVPGETVVEALAEQAERDAADAAAWREFCERGWLSRVWLVLWGCGR